MVVSQFELSPHPRPFDFATLRTNARPFVLSVARKGGVEAGMPDHVRHDDSLA